MRKILFILIAVLCIGSARAQRVWSSLDGYAQYAVIELDTTDPSKIVLNDKQRPILNYLSDVVRSNKDDISSKRYRVWVESYVSVDGDAQSNIDLARKMSNIVKSHLIVTDGLTENSFTTRNFSGTFDGLSAVTIVVIGFRYPLEQLLPKQRIDVEGPNSLTNHYDSLSLTQADMLPVALAIGVDTAAILTPRFKVLSFDNMTDQSSGMDGMLSPSNVTDDPSLVPTPNDPSISLSAPDFYANPQSISVSTHDVRPFDETADMRFKPVTPLPVYSVGQTDIAESKTDKTAATIPPDRHQTPIDPGDEVVTIAHNTSQLSHIAPDATTTQQLVEPHLAAANGNFQKRQPENVLPPITTEPLGVWSLDGAAQRQGSQPTVIASEQSPQSNVTGSFTDTEMQANQVGRKKKKSVGKKQTDADNSIGVDFSSQSQSQSQSAVVSPEELNEMGRSNDQPVQNSPRKRGKNSEITVSQTDGKLTIDASAFEQSINSVIIAEQQSAEREQRAKDDQAIREMSRQRVTEKRRAVRLSKGRFAVAGIGINALTTAILKPSIQFDAYFSDRLSIAAEWYYSKWNFDQTNIFNLSMASLELRYFVMGKKKAFEGLYIGVYGSAGEYDFRWGKQTGQQSAFLTAGLSVGYVLPLGKSGFYLEAGLSAGYVTENIEKYLHYNGEYIRTGEKFPNQLIFVPTKIKVSFIYRLFNKRKNRD